MTRIGSSSRRRLGRRLAALIATALALATALPAGAADGPATAIYVPKPNHGAIEQIAALRAAGRMGDADLIASMIATPQAVWFTQGTPAEVQRSVRATVKRAAGKQQVPVLVAYNIPFRDCAQFSAGGATNGDEYAAWIDAFAAGVGSADAIVILEPDGLGIIPWYNPFADRDTWVTNPNYEWCQPAEADPATAAADRFEMLNHAVAALKAQPNTKVYLDGTHSSWLGAGDAADRLIQAGVNDADGFFLNASNYRLDAHLEKYGTWTAKCVAFASNPASWGVGHSEWCASQYFPANPNDFSTWGLTDQWYTDNVESQTWWYSESVLEHFVVDTSRNGQGPWTPPSYPDPQDWCNPPGRGLGVTPTTDTGNSLIDAFLWIKIPGESDGECTRGLGPAGSTVDPEWGVVDPAAGDWIGAMALDLARNAAP
ncbi:MAG TPA: glycoside hydrolase family 6 protein [Candidatus Limnocylindrales bacterium]|nr:glycoside hydrolase family 6 protein [Candidatus Limnocylindrales bacterium]